MAMKDITETALNSELGVDGNNMPTKILGRWYLIGRALPRSSKMAYNCYKAEMVISDSGVQKMLNYEFICRVMNQKTRTEVNSVGRGYLTYTNVRDVSKMRIVSTIPKGAAPKDYWIYHIDDDSMAVANAGSAGNGLDADIWIYSRSETMSFCKYKDIYQMMYNRGFNLSLLAVGFESLTECSPAEASAIQNKPAVTSSSSSSSSSSGMIPAPIPV